MATGVRPPPTGGVYDRWMKEAYASLCLLLRWRIWSSCALKVFGILCQQARMHMLFASRQRYSPQK